MPKASILIFEDNQCESLRPAGLFSPLSDLRVAAMTLEDVVRPLGMPVRLLTRNHFVANGHENPVVGGTVEEMTLFLNASVEPDVRHRETIRRLIESGDPVVTTSGNRVAAALVPAGTVLPEKIDTETVQAVLLGLGFPLENRLFTTIDWPHEIVASHLRLFASNIAALVAGDGFTELQPGVLARNNTVNVDPSCVFDTTNGPVVLEDGVRVLPFTYFEGPVYVGAGTRIIEHASLKDRTAVGPGCKIGGEVETSSIGARTNKQHHGFLGHSWVGRWVNLGAGTTTSDLKNTYGVVRMEYGALKMETDMQFLGAIVGDYVKTAINTSIFTGKTIGACSLIFGTVTKNVSSFTNYARSLGQVTEVSLDQVLVTQQRMFERRGIEQTPYDIEIMRRAFETTRGERVMSDAQINF